MKKLRDWIASHIVITLIICSIIFAIVVHVLFSTPAPNEWWFHKWEAGDILTYVSTVALGLLAVWQNQRFKDENDKTQERLEKISIEANELNLISKIVESESQYIATLDDTFSQFFEICGVENLSVLMSGTYDKDKVMDGLKRMSQLPSKLKRVTMSGYSIKGYNIVPLLNKFAKIYKAASKMLIDYDRTKIKSKESLNTLMTLCSDAEEEKDRYICLRRNILQTVLFEGLSINEIRALYVKPEEIKDGKNENGVN